jgi:hypothetical protein
LVILQSEQARFAEAPPNRYKDSIHIRIVQITQLHTVAGAAPEPKNQIGIVQRGGPIAPALLVCLMLKAVRCCGVPRERLVRRLGESAKIRDLKGIASVPGSQQRRVAENCIGLSLS